MRYVMALSLVFLILGCQKLSPTTSGISSLSCGTANPQKAMIQALPTGADPEIPQQEHHASISTFRAWPIFYSQTTGIRAPLTIAVLDNGVDITHADLQNQIWTNPLEIPGNQIDDDRNGFVDDINGYNFVAGNANITPTEVHSSSDHGTHIAGLISAASNNIGGVGMAPGLIKILPVVVYDKSGVLKASQLDAGIRYAANQGVDVINLSLGTYQRSESTIAAIEYATQKGSFVVVAASNESGDLDGDFRVYPAKFAQDMLGVVAVASYDMITGLRSQFSNYGPNTVEIAAPGSPPLLATSQLNRSSAHNGTSVATPLVAAAAALIKGFVVSRTGQVLSPKDLEALLQRISPTSSDLVTATIRGQKLNLFTIAQVLDETYPQKYPLPAIPNPVVTRPPTPPTPENPTPENPTIPVTPPALTECP